MYLNDRFVYKVVVICYKKLCFFLRSLAVAILTSVQPKWHRYAARSARTQLAHLCAHAKRATPCDPTAAPAKPSALLPFCFSPTGSTSDRSASFILKFELPVFTISAPRQSCFADESEQRQVYSNFKRSSQRHRLRLSLQPGPGVLVRRVPRHDQTSAYQRIGT